MLVLRFPPQVSEKRVAARSPRALPLDMSALRGREAFEQFQLKLPHLVTLSKRRRETLMLIMLHKTSTVGFKVNIGQM